jgi:hypothetical protein
MHVYADTPLDEKNDVEQEKNRSNNSASQNTPAQNNLPLEDFLTKLKIEQGIANFTQKKHFTFLNNPIVSKGILKVHQTRVIWQVNTPVFSKLVIFGGQVWQQMDQGNNLHSSNDFQKVASHASVETLIRAVFTGEINRAQWNITLDDEQCLQLSPTDLILSQAINKITVCVPKSPTQRFVTLTDAQRNLTEIELNITSNQLLDEDIREFNIH